MDGRVQIPVIDYLRTRCGVDYVDTITEPGPVRIIAEQPARRAVQAILDRVDLSTKAHKSNCIAISAHWDCAANPVTDEKQKEQLYAAITFLQKQYPGTEVIGLWLGEGWIISEI
jgi:hypothetical protein